MNALNVYREFLGTISVYLDAKGQDQFQECMGSLCSPSETLHVVLSLMQTEFERKHKKEAGSILRGASLASKMSSKLSRTGGQDYLVQLFTPWLKKVEAMEELNIEVDTDRNSLFAITHELVQLISNRENVVG
jgi:hypothetical protein